MLWDGHAIGPAEQLRFGYMPEERGLYPRMRVGEQIEYFGRLHGLGAGAANVATREWLERLGLADRAGARVEELSHGNQQRAQLTAALVHGPELLVLDEPFAGLDPVAVRTLVDVLRGEAAGVALAGREDGDLRLVALRDVRPGDVLRAAEQTATVIEFSYGPPSLSELFGELVER